MMILEVVGSRSPAIKVRKSIRAPRELVWKMFDKKTVIISLIRKNPNLIRIFAESCPRERTLMMSDFRGGSEGSKKSDIRSLKSDDERVKNRRTLFVYVPLSN